MTTVVTFPRGKTCFEIIIHTKAEKVGACGDV